MDCHILIIDDDKDLCILIKQCAAKEAISADYCHSGTDGLEMFEKKKYHLIILDVMMPGINGFQTLDKIRSKSNIPILMLTAKDDCTSKIYGLRSGADDYLAKPFHMEELIARIISLVRRYTRFNETEYGARPLIYKGLSIDFDSRCVTTQNGIFELPPKEFDLLLFCARNQGRILTKQQIYEAVWKEAYVYDDSNIMAIISRLRKKIEPDPGTPFYIQTIKGIGYRFNREV